MGRCTHSRALWNRTCAADNPLRAGAGAGGAPSPRLASPRARCGSTTSRRHAGLPEGARDHSRPARGCSRRSGRGAAWRAADPLAPWRLPRELPVTRSRCKKGRDRDRDRDSVRLGALFNSVPTALPKSSIDSRSLVEPRGGNSCTGPGSTLGVSGRFYIWACHLFACPLKPRSGQFIFEKSKAFRVA